MFSKEANHFFFFSFLFCSALSLFHCYFFSTLWISLHSSHSKHIEFMISFFCCLFFLFDFTFAYFSAAINIAQISHNLVKCIARIINNIFMQRQNISSILSFIPIEHLSIDRSINRVGWSSLAHICISYSYMIIMPVSSLPFLLILSGILEIDYCISLFFISHRRLLSNWTCKVYAYFIDGYLSILSFLSVFII